jgi:D-arabinose 1-dehydrogenase-like Zn-dependent alcohol dehydrogenase
MSGSHEGTSYDVYRGVDGKLTATPATIPKIGPKDVLVKITHSGVCYTDYELYSVGLKLALGHEGTGIVEEVGSDVKTLKVGDRVGGGFHRDSCGNCKYCKTGRDILCHDRLEYCQGDYDNGTFAAWYHGKETHLYKIPDSMPSEVAAPLQCAGATVYAALDSVGVKATDRVGIIGVGGLGHLAIQFASKMGAEVVVFSTSKEKEAEARGFGASEFVLLEEPDKVSAPVNLLLLFGPTYPDWTK